MVAVGVVGIGTAIQPGGSEWRDCLDGIAANHPGMCNVGGELGRRISDISLR